MTPLVDRDPGDETDFERFVQGEPLDESDFLDRALSGLDTRASGARVRLYGEESFA